EQLFSNLNMSFVKETADSKANYWLNSIILNDSQERDEFLAYTNDNGVMTRPVWELMNRLPMFANCQTDGLENCNWLADRVVNIPSGYRL
ncbi:DegT/DnrJ/EryC1/StrS family aminotransferase, partial [Pedobacter sp. ASV12]|uniref:DegT/DnrJ/EryC1/StrS family aminotransferase n=1 Tax=Pedobacter sp. ASV12 TaxID=2795120 RepID=UPI001E2B77A6